VGGLDVERVVARRSEVDAVAKNFYDLRTSLKTSEKQLSARSLPAFDLGNQEYLSAQAGEMDPAAAPVVRALNHLLNYAFEQRASDIHFEPKRNVTFVRLRIDGMLHDVHVVPRIVYQAIISRIKLLSGCNLAEKRRPQDGRIKREQAGREIESFLGNTHGIILVTGPTGSGETTTLYSVLKHLSKPEVNIVTIEDPIEMVHEDLNQVAVGPAIDLTFAAALRTVLGQDPDIIMVGEIRDTETAENAVQAALTGHLVFSTLHTNDAPSAIMRLLDLGVPHFFVLSTVIGIIAQHLVRVNCPHCSEEFVPSAEELAGLQHDDGATRRPHAATRRRLPELPPDRLPWPRRRVPIDADQRADPQPCRATGGVSGHRRSRAPGRHAHVARGRCREGA
jgi:general secretion pathway protein E